MRRLLCSVIVVSLFVLLGQSSAPAEKPAEPVGPLTAAEATAAFFAAVHDGEIDRAIAMTAPMPEDIPEQRIREFYQVIGAYTKRTGVPEVVGHMRLDNAAVVVFKDVKPGKTPEFDLDPAYLVRQNGRWLVTYKLTQFDEGFHEFDKPTRDRFRTLRTWFEGQRTTILNLLSAGE